MKPAALTVVLLVLAGAFVLMVEDAVGGGDWPGWDEGWALVAFPIGIPLALYLEQALRRQSRPLRAALFGTVAVWIWGAAVFAAWHFLGT